MEAEAYQLLCDLGSDVGESVFSDIHQVVSLCKVQTADKKHLELVLGLRCWEIIGPLYYTCRCGPSA